MCEDGTFRVELEEIRFLEGLIGSAGLNAQKLLHGLDLPGDLFAMPPETAVSYEQYFRIMQGISDALDDETCGASSRQLMHGTTQFLLNGLAGSQTLLEAVRRLASAYNFVHGGEFNRIILRPREIVYVIDDRDFPYAFSETDGDHHAFIESVMVFLHVLLTEITDRPLDRHVTRIWTRRSRTAPGGAFLEFWDAPVRRAAPNYAVHFDRTLADEKLDGGWRADFPDGHVYDVVANRLSADRRFGLGRAYWSRRVRAAIASGIDSQPGVAAALGMSLPTLRRRLADEQESFRDIKARVLDERAKSLLRSGWPPGDVAEALGFSDLRSFSRAFKARNGLTPTAFRTGTSSLPAPS